MIYPGLFISRQKILRRKLKNHFRTIHLLFGLSLLATLGSMFSNCTEDEKMVPFTESEVIRLLSGDTTKSWLRVSFQLNGADQGSDDCDLYTITTFYIGPSDSLKYTIVSNPVYCPSPADTLESGDWRILNRTDNQETADKIEFIFEGDTLQKQIEQITSLYLYLSQSENELLFQSSYDAIIPE